MSAVDRSKPILHGAGDFLVPASERGAGQYSPTLLAAIDHALAFNEADRPQSLAAWRAELLGEVTVPASAPMRPAATPDESPTDRASPHTERPPAPPADPAPTCAPTRPAMPTAATSPASDDTARGAPSGPAPAVYAVTAPPARSRWRGPALWLAIVIAGSMLGFGALRAALHVVLSPDGSHRLQTAARSPLPAPPAPSAAPGEVPDAAPQLPAVAMDTVADAVASDTMPEDAPAATTAPAPATALAPDPATRVRELLARADADYAAMRLTTPPGDNAYEKYREVLVLEPGNAQALDGIETIAQGYLKLARSAAQARDWPRVESMLEHAARVKPGDARIERVGERLRTLLRQRTASAAQRQTGP
jgi:hypothetical protein